MTPRHQSIDALRGLAVMGILLMNLAGFALPSGAYFNPAATGTPSSVDLAIWAASFVFVDGKMRALFSILFGASTLIVVTRAAAAGEDPARIHLARMGTLALFGIVHGLLWPGDILLHYAIVGALALPFTALEPRQQVRVAVMLLVAQAVVQGWLLLGDIQLRADTLAPGASAAIRDRWHAFSAAVGIGRPQEIAAEIATHRGPWHTLVAANAHDIAAGTPFILVFDGLETLAYMLIGMAALPWLAKAQPPRRLAVPALAIGVMLSALLAWAAAASGFDTIATFAAATLGGVALRPLLALAYAALAIGWLARDRAAQRRLAAVGRMAFSNYLATSLMMTALFDGWGLGLYARLSRGQVYAIVPLVWLAMLAWSPVWLARFRYGPLEWLWRSMARGKIQPLRKNTIAR